MDAKIRDICTSRPEQLLLHGKKKVWTNM